MELDDDTCGNLADSLPKRKGARADEWNGLEHRRGFRPTVGSNPTPSAIFNLETQQVVLIVCGYFASLYRHE